MCACQCVDVAAEAAAQRNSHVYIKSWKLFRAGFGFGVRVRAWLRA